eukprot:m51a1_g13228 hypothetical protein (333) ;mRNA; r:35-1303
MLDVAEREDAKYVRAFLQEATYAVTNRVRTFGLPVEGDDGDEGDDDDEAEDEEEEKKEDEGTGSSGDAANDSDTEDEGEAAPEPQKTLAEVLAGTPFEKDSAWYFCPLDYTDKIGQGVSPSDGITVLCCAAIAQDPVAGPQGPGHGRGQRRGLSVARGLQQQQAVDIARMLLAAGADVLRGSPDGGPLAPLACACRTACPALVDTLLKARANAKGVPPGLWRHCPAGHNLEAPKGSRRGQSRWCRSCRRPFDESPGSLKCPRCFDYWVCRSCVSVLERADPLTPLSIAREVGAEQVVQLLLENGAVEQPKPAATVSDRSPLHKAKTAQQRPR